MAFNGSGTYNLPAGNPVVTGTTISSSTTNTTNSDIATALTNCITRDGQSTPSANLPMNAKKLTGLAAGTSAGDSVRYEQVVLTGAALGTPTSGTLTSCTGLPLTTGVTGTLPVANGGTGVTTSTGSGNNVLSTSPTLSTPTLVTPILGTPTSGTLTSCTGLPLTTGVTGTLPVGNGGTGVTTSTGSGNNVLSTSPTLTTPVLGTPSSGDLSSCTNAVGYGLKSATTTVSVSSATAPTTGQVLMATSSTGATWQTPSGGGAWIYIGSVSASSSATVDLTGIDSTYSLYAVIGEQIKTSNIALQMQIIIDGTVFTTASYAYHVTNCTQASGSYAGLGNTSDNAPILSANLENNGAFVMYISGARATVKKTFHWTGSLSNSTANMAMCHGSAAVNTTGTMTGVRFKPASSTITSGNFHLYGIRNS